VEAAKGKEEGIKTFPQASVFHTRLFLFMSSGLKSVSPVPSKQSMAENERFIVIQLKPLLNFADKDLTKKGRINPSNFHAMSRTPTTWTILKQRGISNPRALDSVTVCG
jgi:hypothetical protein